MLTIVEPPDIIPEGTSSDMNVGEGGQVNILASRYVLVILIPFNRKKYVRLITTERYGFSTIKKKALHRRTLKCGINFDQEPFPIISSPSTQCRRIPSRVRARARGNKFASKYASKRDALWRY